MPSNSTGGSLFQYSPEFYVDRLSEINIALMTESYTILGGYARLISHLEPRAVNGFKEHGLAGVGVAYYG